MFVVGASYLSLLRGIAARCCLPYASLVCEVAEDGTAMCGVDIELPCGHLEGCLRTLFFWAPADTTAGCAYEHAALQAVTYLGLLYWIITFRALSYIGG
ncbi:hypothetical protein BS78_04G224800 [Paspalum vaginatum]|nr:hypothetical protein BS78_04G224800 [Paspalum vaginatum]